MIKYFLYDHNGYALLRRLGAHKWETLVPGQRRWVRADVWGLGDEWREMTLMDLIEDLWEVESPAVEAICRAI